jgi:cytochrome b561
MVKNTESSFGIGSRFFHWVVGLMIIGMLAVGFYMSSLPNSPDKFEIYGLHKATGVIVLCLVVLRLLWRVSNIVPVLPSTMPNWQVVGYKFGVTAMYLLMLAMPISGVFMTRYSGYDISVFGLFTIEAFEKNPDIVSLAQYIHGLGGYAFVLFIVMHSSIALYHHFIDTDRLLMRMIKGE